MAKRFSRLDLALYYAAGEATPYVPNDTARIKKYYDYTQNVFEVTHVVEAMGEKQLVVVKNFNYPADTDTYNVKISDRAFKAMTDATKTGNIDKYNHIATDPDAIYNPAFVPAKVVITQLLKDRPVDPIKSNITGFEYYRMDVDSFTIPFGEKSASPVGEGGVQNEIGDALDADAGNFAYTFKSEKWKRGL